MIFSYMAVLPFQPYLFSTKSTVMPACQISYTRTLCLCSCSWELHLYRNKHEAKCTSQIVWHLLLFCSLL